jgi:hypothetical protein
MRNYLVLASLLLTSLNVHAQEKDYYVIPHDIKCVVKKSNKITYCNDLNDKPITGEMRRYNNGALKHSYLLKNGILDGITKTYYRNGTIKAIKTYKEGKLNGLSSENYENGNPKEEISYLNGKREGVTKQYYEDGGLQSQAVYKNDKINGEYRIYDTAQQLIYNFKSENSILKSGTYYYKAKNGQVKQLEMPTTVVKAITLKCAQIHTENSENPCAVNDIKNECNTKWLAKNQEKLDEYYKECNKK